MEWLRNLLQRWLGVEEAYIHLTASLGKNDFIMGTSYFTHIRVLSPNGVEVYAEEIGYPFRALSADDAHRKKVTERLDAIEANYVAQGLKVVRTNYLD